MALQTTARRTFTVSFPAELAERVEQMAKRESRTMSELFRQAFRAYHAQQVMASLEAFRAANQDTRSFS
jgi:metal-responsive CopG/Arc/MetJ family transcriptional regulator